MKLVVYGKNRYQYSPFIAKKQATILSFATEMDDFHFFVQCASVQKTKIIYNENAQSIENKICNEAFGQTHDRLF